MQRREFLARSGKAAGVSGMLATVAGCSGSGSRPDPSSIERRVLWDGVDDAPQILDVSGWNHWYGEIEDDRREDGSMIDTFLIQAQATNRDDRSRSVVARAGFYDADDNRISWSRAGIPSLPEALDPGETAQFTLGTAENLTEIDHYRVVIEVKRW